MPQRTLLWAKLLIVAIIFTTFNVSVFSGELIIIISYKYIITLGFGWVGVLRYENRHRCSLAMSYFFNGEHASSKL